MHAHAKTMSSFAPAHPVRCPAEGLVASRHLAANPLAFSIQLLRSPTPMRSLSTLISAVLVTAAFATAQVTPVAATGCSEGLVGGDAPFAVDGQAPAVGNLTFALEHSCNPGSNAAFFFFGGCEAPLVDWNLTDSCFGAWSPLPSSCGKAVSDLGLAVFGDLVRQGGKVTFAIPIPNLPSLISYTATNPICVQFICVDLTRPNPCLGVSTGLQIQIQ